MATKVSKSTTSVDLGEGALSSSSDAFGGSTLWKQLEEKVLVDPTNEGLGLTGAGSDDTEDNKRLTDSFVSGIDKAMGMLESSGETLAKAEKANSAFLSGQIPADVSAAVRRAASENSITRGIGAGQAARAMSARDLGIVSTDLISKGIENEKELAAASSEIASKVASTSVGYEQLREWNKGYEKDLAGLRMDAAKSNLSALQEEEDREQYNITNKLKLLDFATKLIDTQWQTAATLSSLKVDSKDELASIQAYIDDLIGLANGTISPTSSTSTDKE